MNKQMPSDKIAQAHQEMKRSWRKQDIKYWSIAIVIALVILGAGITYASNSTEREKEQLIYDIGQYEGQMSELSRENNLDRTLKAELILKNQAELEAIIERQNGEVNVIDNRIANRSFQWRKLNGFLIWKKAQLEKLGKQ